MKKLSELSDETLLYVEVFNDLKSIVPDVKVVTKKEYVSNQDLFCKGNWSEIFIAIISPISFFLEDFLEQFEYKINEVLMRHPNYIAGESVENDVWREKTNENRDR